MFDPSVGPKGRAKIWGNLEARKSVRNLGIIGSSFLLNIFLSQDRKMYGYGWSGGRVGRRQEGQVGRGTRTFSFEFLGERGTVVLFQNCRGPKK